MRGFKKLLSFILPSVMMLAMAMTPANATETAQNCTRVTIHKVVGTAEFTLRNHDGSQLTSEQIRNLGTDAVENNTGVEFTLWKVPAGTLVTAFNGKTDTEVTQSNLTDTPIVVRAGYETSFANGTYYARETKHPATLKSQSGIPFIMELPALNAAGNQYLSQLHIYPKNVIEDDMPVIDKDVETKNQDHGGYDVGEVFEYLIYPKVPKGIESYTVFKVRDILASTLDYMDTVTIKYNGVTFNEQSDYTLQQNSTGSAGGGFTIEFTQTGLQKLATNRPTSETLKDLEIRYKARINKTAVMGTDIYNNAELIYNNGYFSCDKSKDVPTGNRPEVHTGGRQFIKVDNISQTYLSALASASFAVKNSAGKYMKQETNGNVSWVTTLSSATKIHVDDNNGSFEVTGFAYGDMDEEVTYKLEEVDVPTGYIKMNDLEFKIGKNSYGDKTNINDNTKVTNTKKPIIPQTGGIGTIIFLSIGLLMMGTSVLIMKRKVQSKQ